MSKNKLVLFDWGGVFEVQGEINMGCTEFFTEIAKQLGTSIHNDELYIKLEDYIKTKDFLDIIYDSSDIALDNNIRKILSIFGVEDSFENISKYKRYFLINSFNVPTNTELVEYAHSLKGRCEIGLLSNCTVLEKYKQDIDVTRSAFDYVFLSCDLGCMKPYKEIYDLANLYDYDILFIDDREENLRYPKELGWKTYLFNGNNEDVKKAIEEFLN